MIERISLFSFCSSDQKNKNKLSLCRVKKTVDKKDKGVLIVFQVS